MDRTEEPIIDNTKFAVARKDYICTTCGDPILKGSRYLRNNELSSEGWTQRKTHEKCSSDILADYDDEREFETLSDEEEDSLDGWEDDPYRDDFEDEQRLTETLDEFIYYD